MPLWHALRFDTVRLAGPDALAQHAEQALGFTSTVSLAPPDLLLLDTGASLGYFGGRKNLERLMRESWSPTSITIGAAPTPGAAALLARWRDGACCDALADLPRCLGPLPVGLLASARNRLAELEAASLRRIAQLLELPRAGLARRFGQALLDELDRALGRLPDPRAHHAPVLRFSERLVLLARADSSPALAPAIAILVDRLCQQLRILHRSARCLVLDIAHDDHPETRIVVRLASTAWQPERLLPVLNERLARLALPEPATALRLECLELEMAGPASDRLFPDPASIAGELSVLLERLQARLGPGQVQCLHALAEDRPEAAWRASNAIVAPPGRPLRPAPGPPVGASRHASLPRPLWLLERPLALGECHGHPHRDGPLQLLGGPERIESGWWDDLPVRRDYFVAADPLDRLLWIYREWPREGLAGAWFLHGHFG